MILKPVNNYGKGVKTLWLHKRHVGHSVKQTDLVE